jgi:hypothetical protein
VGKKQLLFAVEKLFYRTDRQGIIVFTHAEKKKKKKKKKKSIELSISFPREEASDIKIKNKINE